MCLILIFRIGAKLSTDLKTSWPAEDMVEREAVHHADVS